MLYQYKEEFAQSLADDFYEIGASGQTCTKAMQLAQIGGEERKDIPAILNFQLVALSNDCVQMRYDTLESSDRRVHRFSIWQKKKQ